MAAMDHPNITRVIDYEESQSYLAITMEMLAGEDMSEYIKSKGKLSEDRIKDIFQQVLSAFSYAHDKGIVHRDVKPSNIFLLPNGQVKILDFGIAKLFGQGNEMTQTGTQMGTPIYMSPEQVKADKSIDHRSDIYSLGVTMYFALNGKPPYDSDTSSQFDIFNKIVHETIPLSTLSGDLVPSIEKACPGHLKVASSSNFLIDYEKYAPSPIFGSILVANEWPAKESLLCELDQLLPYLTGYEALFHTLRECIDQEFK
jgi:serine/threonine protein kinase